MYYAVVRRTNRAEYTTVEAGSKDDAIRIAKELGEECWEDSYNIYI